MTPYESFLPEVMPHVHNCPQDYAVNAIRNACIEFCDQTHWLTIEPDAQTVLPNVDTYDVEFSKGVVPIRLEWLKINDIDAHGHLTKDNQIVLRDMPTTRLFNALTMSIAIRPSRSSTSVDDSLFERWAEGIASGALARIYATPAQPFSSPELALARSAMFKAAKADAQAEKQRELTVGPLYVRMRRF
jgi:hypothetical protein